jgi:hypothetical protein
VVLPSGMMVAIVEKQTVWRWAWEPNLFAPEKIRLLAVGWMSGWLIKWKKWTAMIWVKRCEKELNTLGVRGSKVPFSKKNHVCVTKSDRMHVGLAAPTCYSPSKRWCFHVGFRCGVLVVIVQTKKHGKNVRTWSTGLVSGLIIWLLTRPRKRTKRVLFWLKGFYSEANGANEEMKSIIILKIYR